MALIPVTFKHPKNATEEKDKKIGKVSTITARMLYANTFSGKVGIVKGYKKDDATDELSVAYDNTATTSTTFRLVFNKGAVSIYGGVGIVEQGTVLDIARGLTNNSVGIRINLANPAGQEMEWYVKSPSETLQKDDLQIHDTDGVYEFELFKITTTGDTPTVSEKTTQYIQSVKDYVEGRIDSMGFKQGSITLNDGITASVNEIKKRGYYCILSCSFMITQAQLKLLVGGTPLILGTVSEKFIPNSSVEVQCSVGQVRLEKNTSGGMVAVTRDCVCSLLINPDGEVRLIARSFVRQNIDIVSFNPMICKINTGYETPTN